MIETTIPHAMVQLAFLQFTLEQAQDCINGDTPEYGSAEDARQDTLKKIRAALLNTIPAMRKAMQNV